MRQFVRFVQDVFQQERRQVMPLIAVDKHRNVKHRRAW
jgi:hypothetical protein